MAFLPKSLAANNAPFFLQRKVKELNNVPQERHEKIEPSPFFNVLTIQTEKKVKEFNNVPADFEKRKTLIDDRFPCASIEDIIESKRAAKRQRDKEELPRLKAFKDELKKRK